MNSIGAHVTGGRDLTRSLVAAKALNCEAIQIFFDGPTSFKLTPPEPGKDELFVEGITEAGIDVFVHGPYLMNFGSQKDSSRAIAARLLKANLKRAQAIGAKGVVLHAGSSGDDGLAAGLKRLRESLLPLLDSLDADSPPVLLEPMAGQGTTLSSTVDSVADYLAAVDGHEKLQVCLDTAHLWAAGEDLSTFESTTAMLNNFDRQVGLDRLALIHANESKAAMGSHLDRHQNLHNGEIGQALWVALFSHPGVTAPLVLETPKDGHHHDLALLRTARCLTASHAL